MRKGWDSGTYLDLINDTFRQLNVGTDQIDDSIGRRL